MAAMASLEVARTHICEANEACNITHMYVYMCIYVCICMCVCEYGGGDRGGAGFAGGGEGRDLRGEKGPN